MNSQGRNEIAQRIEIARKMKADSFGSAEIGEDVFGDDSERAKNSERYGWRQHGVTVSQADAVRMAQWASHKESNGGIIGVVPDGPKTDRTRRFRATRPGNPSRTYHKCAVEAAEARNAYAEEDYPGIDIAKCDIDAVYRRWGCACGKHRRDT